MTITIAWIVSVAHKDDHMFIEMNNLSVLSSLHLQQMVIVLNFRKIFNPKIYHNQCYNRSILGKNYN